MPGKGRLLVLFDFNGAIIGFKQGRHIIDSTWECFISSFIYPQKYPH
jgi:hypothetical protein